MCLKQATSIYSLLSIITASCLIIKNKQENLSQSKARKHHACHLNAFSFFKAYGLFGGVQVNKILLAENNIFTKKRRRRRRENVFIL